MANKLAHPSKSSTELYHICRFLHLCWHKARNSWWCSATGQDKPRRLLWSENPRIAINSHEHSQLLSLWTDWINWGELVQVHGNQHYEWRSDIFLQQRPQLRMIDWLKSSNAMQCGPHSRCLNTQLGFLIFNLSLWRSICLWRNVWYIHILEKCVFIYKYLPAARTHTYMSWCYI